MNRELMRRADVIGILPNDEAIVRLVGALVLETTDERAAARRSVSLETLACVTDTATVGLPGVAAWSASGLFEGRRSYTTPPGHHAAGAPRRRGTVRTRERLDHRRENSPRKARRPLVPDPPRTPITPSRKM